MTEAMDLAKTLDELSAKAMDGVKATGYKYFGEYELSEDQWEAVDALVEFARFATESIRTGKLIVVPDDAVERMAELQLAAFLAGRGSVTSMKHGTRAAKPGPTMDDYRRMALAALKGADHAG